jgi:hypothetical protein
LVLLKRREYIGIASRWTHVVPPRAVAVHVDRDVIGGLFAKRFWRTIKYKEADLHPYESVGEAPQSISGYLGVYNATTPHSR